jgi:hypothetical protein
METGSLLFMISVLVYQRVRDNRRPVTVQVASEIIISSGEEPGYFSGITLR